MKKIILRENHVYNIKISNTSLNYNEVTIEN